LCDGERQGTGIIHSEGLEIMRGVLNCVFEEKASGMKTEPMFQNGR
jgi:hypothetical protein